MAYDDYGNYIDENQYGYSDPFGQNSAQAPNAPAPEQLDQQVAALPTPDNSAVPPQVPQVPAMLPPQAPIESFPTTPESGAPMPFDEYGNWTDPNGNQGPPPPQDPMPYQVSPPEQAMSPAPQAPLSPAPDLAPQDPMPPQISQPSQQAIPELQAYAPAPQPQQTMDQQVAALPTPQTQAPAPAPQVSAPQILPPVTNPLSMPQAPQMQDVGTDPFSQQLEGGISNIINNGGASQSQTGQSLDAAIQSLLASGGRLGQGESDAQRASRFESLRQPIDMGKNAMMSQLMGELADRGQVGSGMETGAIENMFANRIAPQFATALQQSGTALDSQMGNEAVSRLGSAMGAGTNKVGQEGTNTQNAINSGNQRQQMLSEVALKNLDQNRQWNQFLAEYGLNRDLALNMMQNGQVSQLLQMFQAYMSMQQGAAGGFV